MRKQVLRWLVLVLVGAAGSSTASAEQLASYKTGGHRIVLRTERCATGEQKLLKRADKRSGGRLVKKGCWFVNERGNPVLRWQGDRQTQEIQGSLFRFEPKYAALLGEPPASKRPARQSPSPPSAFSRPAWCKAARQPHELLICRDRALAAADLRLAPLWRSYQVELKLSRSEQARHRNEFQSRLKACGANRTCIARVQTARIRFYEKALDLG